jgi:MerR family transcriptional regulator, light-induced transcriptional regulator
MYNYTLKNLSQISGLEEQMVILWNKKFKLFREEKIDKDSLFNSDELKKLIIVSFLINSNKKYTVEKLSPLSLNELRVSTEFEIQNFLHKNTDYKPLVSLMIVACFTYDPKYFDSILAVCYKIVGIGNTTVKILFPFLGTISEILKLHLVQDSIISFTTNLIRKNLYSLIKSQPYSDKESRNWLIFSPENEQSELELLYAYLLLRLNQENGIYLGVDQPLSSIKECINNINISHIFIYISKEYNIEILNNYLHEIKVICPELTIIIASYEKLNQNITEEINFFSVHSPEVFIEYVENIAAI